MKNMTEAELEQADVVLAPVETPDEDSEDSWQLPCHSVILSAHSAVFSASKRSVGSLEAELNHEGKRILRLPLSKGAAEILLQHCYGVFDKLYDMSPEQAFELATVSDMQALKGNIFFRCSNPWSKSVLQECYKAQHRLDVSSPFLLCSILSWNP